jgi:hypothetical protein
VLPLEPFNQSWKHFQKEHFREITFNQMYDYFTTLKEG